MANKLRDASLISRTVTCRELSGAFQSSRKCNFSLHRDLQDVQSLDNPGTSFAMRFRANRLLSAFEKRGAQPA
jgi:hypothetical protein